MPGTVEKRHSLIITGMHRSYTSLVARAFMDAGLFLGDDLIGPDIGNTDGHFECRQVVDFHRQALQKVGLTAAPWLPRLKKLRQISNDNALLRAATEMTDTYFSQMQYGWKDPRAGLFLPLWQKALPHSHFFFVFRNPMECIQSLISRSVKKGQSRQWWIDAWRYLNLWTLTNMAILKCINEIPSSCLLMHAPIDFTSEIALSIINDTLRNQWQFELEGCRFDLVYNEELVSVTDIHPIIKTLYRIHPGARRTYANLIRHHAQMIKSENHENSL